MEIWLSVMSGLLGGLIAMTVIDMVHRRAALKLVLSTKKDFDETISKLHSVHNELSTKVIEMGDRVSQHDFQLNAKMTMKPSMRS